MPQPLKLGLVRPLLATALLLLSATASHAAAQGMNQSWAAQKDDDLTTPLITERVFIPYAENTLIALLRWRRDEDTALNYSLSKMDSEEARLILKTLMRENLDAAAAMMSGVKIVLPEDLVDFMEVVQNH